MNGHFSFVFANCQISNPTTVLTREISMAGTIAMPILRGPCGVTHACSAVVTRPASLLLPVARRPFRFVEERQSRTITLEIGFDAVRYQGE
ncbi:hypothetical protein ElyMa_005770500 [Elysia marginata]|uniref:Uncharacterized protein n=1 Tax=Elysia marginata TaxID=1093978 RepID=A0AAV4FQD5_9GAST|nr:hypothetical protein ElyMa_005770500 [Elysia marginata]